MPSHDFQPATLAAKAMATLHRRVHARSTLIAVAAAVALAAAPPCTWAVDKKSALAIISNAAQNNSASTASVTLETYAAAGVTGMEEQYLDLVNSALNSEAVDGCEANTTTKVQAIVDGYIAVVTVANGGFPFTKPPPTAAHYIAIGVTGLRETDSTLLVNSAVGVSAHGIDNVNTVAKVQALVDPAIHILAAAGGTPEQAAALTVADFAKLGIYRVNEANLPAAQKVIQLAPRAELDNQRWVLELIGANLGHDRSDAQMTLYNVAIHKTATNESLHAGIYAAAGVTGVDNSNLGAINSVFNNRAGSFLFSLHTAFTQKVVDAYNAILRSADGVAGNTTRPFSAALWREVGVTGMSGLTTAGTPLHLLNDAVDAATHSDVDTVPKLQAMADAAAHVIEAPGAETADVFSAEDMQALGIAGVDNMLNLAHVQAALAALPSSTAVDTKAKLQDLVRASTRNDSHEPDPPPRVY